MGKEKKSIEKNDHSCTAWVKKYKGILIAGGTILVIGAGYAVCKNWDYILKLNEPKRVVIINPQASVKGAMSVVEAISETPTGAVKNTIKDGEAFGVCEHIRNLPMGRNTSMEKIAMATEHGFTLDEHQTWVKNYSKNCA